MRTPGYRCPTTYMPVIRCYWTLNPNGIAFKLKNKNDMPHHLAKVPKSGSIGPSVAIPSLSPAQNSHSEKLKELFINFIVKMFYFYKSPSLFRAHSLYSSALFLFLIIFIIIYFFFFKEWQP